TQVDVLDLLLVERHGAALPLRHQVDPATRRLGLETGDAKGRARVQAQSAVDAGREVVVGEAGERRAQTTNRPGFNTPSGSKACLIRRMISSVGGGVPHAPTARIMSSDAASMTSAPPAASALLRTLRIDSASPGGDQCAMPAAGEAHQSLSPSRIPRNFSRGVVIRAHVWGARSACSS